MTKALLVLGDGFNEADASSMTAALNTAGIDVIPAGLPGIRATGENGLTIFTETRLNEANMEEFDVILIPGGKKRYLQLLGRSSAFSEILQNRGDKLIASVGNGPVVLANLGLLDDTLTSVHPKAERTVPRPRNGRVIEDNNIITSPDSSCAIDCGLKIVEALQGKAKSEKVREKLAPTTKG